MATHIHFYKQAIGKTASNLETIKNRTGWGPAAIIKLELQLQQAFFALWKLLKEDLLPHSFSHVQIPVKAYPYKNPPNASMHVRRIKKHYKMTDPLPEMRDPAFIASQFVHNAVFEVNQDLDKRLSSIYVTSDHQRHKELYEISIRDIIELLEEAAVSE